jgi:cyanate permease
MFRNLRQGTLQTICHMAVNVKPEYWLLVLEYGIGQSVNWTIQLALEPILVGDGISRSTINNMGAIVRLVGIPSIVLVVVLCSRCRATRVLSSLVWFVALFVLVMLQLLSTTGVLGADTPPALYGMSAAVGFAFAAISPIMFPFIARVGHPINPAMVVLVSYISAQFFALALVVLINWCDTRVSFIVMDVFLGVVCLLSLGNCSIRFKTPTGPASEAIELLERASPFHFNL